MENKINNKTVWLRNLRQWARTTSLIFIVCFTPVIIMMGLSFNSPAPASDYIILGSYSIYVIGLIIGLKRELPGGLISLTYLSIFLIVHIVSNISGIDLYSQVIGIFILMIPCILNILSSYFHRKLEMNHSKSE